MYTMVKILFNISEKSLIAEAGVRYKYNYTKCMYEKGPLYRVTIMRKLYYDLFKKGHFRFVPPGLKFQIV